MMMQYDAGRPVEVLMVEDDPGDVELTIESLKEQKIRNNIHVVDDGEKALAFLRRTEPYRDAPRPDVVLLDLNLPRMDGRDVLRAIKADPALRTIPVIVLTTSTAEEDIARSYELNASCYVSKPIDLDSFGKVVRSIEDFWLTVVRYPPVA